MHAAIIFISTTLTIKVGVLEARCWRQIPPAAWTFVWSHVDREHFPHYRCGTREGSLARTLLYGSSELRGIKHYHSHDVLIPPPRDPKVGKVWSVLQPSLVQHCKSTDFSRAVSCRIVSGEHPAACYAEVTAAATVAIVVNAPGAVTGYGGVFLMLLENQPIKDIIKIVHYRLPGAYRRKK